MQSRQERTHKKSDGAPGSRSRSRVRKGCVPVARPHITKFDRTLERIRRFRDARNWMQFHSPKNLACSVVIEAAELLEHFQWKTNKESSEHAKKRRREISAEIADVAIYLIELADNLGIDFMDAIDQKLNDNEQKYPVARAKNTAAKYTELK
jgi:dCTP diphosphatase